MEPKDIAALSVDEIRTHAPLVFEKITNDAKAELETKVGEQATVVAELTPEAEIAKKVRELLGLAEGENPIEKITSLIEKVEDAAAGEVKAFIEGLISKKVKTERGQSLVKRLIGEMHKNYDSPEDGLTDELKKKIETDFTAKIEGDEDVKALVGEMAAFADEDRGTRGGRGGSGLGGRSTAGAGRGREMGGDGVVKRTENVVVRKVTL